MFTLANLNQRQLLPQALKLRQIMIRLACKGKIIQGSDIHHDQSRFGGPQAKMVEKNEPLHHIRATEHHTKSKVKNRYLPLSCQPMFSIGKIGDKIVE